MWWESGRKKQDTFTEAETSAHLKVLLTPDVAPHIPEVLQRIENMQVPKASLNLTVGGLILNASLPGFSYLGSINAPPAQYEQQGGCK